VLAGVGASQRALSAKDAKDAKEGKNLEDESAVNSDI